MQLITQNYSIQDAPSTSVSNMAEGRDKQLPSFWVPSQTPSSSKSKLQKPVSISKEILYVTCHYQSVNL